MVAKMIVLFMANGTEEIEALTPVDLLRRAGIEVTIVGIGGRRVTGSHGIVMECDMADDEWKAPDDLQGVILPGGMPGTKNLDASPVVDQALRLAASKGALVAAICAAPLILGRRGLLQGRRATCFPGFEEELVGAQLESVPVCHDGQIITARGAGAAMPFGLELVSALCGSERAKAMAGEIQCSV